MSRNVHAVVRKLKYIISMEFACGVLVGISLNVNLAASISITLMVTRIYVLNVRRCIGSVIDVGGDLDMIEMNGKKI